MCGRFTQHYTWQEIHELYGLVGAARNVEPRYNIAPTSAIDVVLLTIDGPALVLMRWGLIPSWWKKAAKDVPSTFNARAETVAGLCDRWHSTDTGETERAGTVPGCS